MHAKPYSTKHNNHYAIVLWSFGLVLSISMGLALALSIYPVVIFLFVAIAGFALIIYPHVGMWVVIIGALVASGMVDLYAPFLKPIVWGLALLSIILSVIALTKSFFEPKSLFEYKSYFDKKLSQARGQYSLKDADHLIRITLLFVFSVVVSSLINWHGVSGFLVGLKGYFQVWGLLIAIYYLTKDVIQAQKLILFFLLLGILQIPAVLHQFLVLVPKRSALIFAEHGIVAGDIVAGTFGGSMTGGGRSSNLALLSVLCVTIMLAKWRAGITSGLLAAVSSIVFLAPMFISEAKIFLVLLPIALFLLFKERILSNPLKAITGLLALLVFLVSIFFAYSLLPGAKSQRVKSIDNMIEQNLSYNIGKKGYGNYSLNRSTVYPFWLNEQIDHNKILNTIIGYGPGSSSGGTALNDKSLAFSQYKGFGIGLTGLSALLWEVGILGTSFAILMFYLAFQLGSKMVKKWQGTTHWPLIKAAQISIPLFAFSLLHNNYFVFDISFQTMFVVVVAYLMVMAKLKTNTAETTDTTLNTVNPWASSQHV